MNHIIRFPLLTSACFLTGSLSAAAEFATADDSSGLPTLGKWKDFIGKSYDPESHRNERRFLEMKLHRSSASLFMGVLQMPS